MNNQAYRDPYIELGVPYDADDTAIRKAFHRKLQNGGEEVALREAYERIKREEDRFAERWFNRESMPLPNGEMGVEIEIDDATLKDLIQELAFLTDWELMREER